MCYTLNRGQSARGPADPSLEARCFGRMVPGTARLKLAGFQEQWEAELTAADALVEVPGSSPGVGFAFVVHLGSSLWQRCIGRQPGIEIHLTLKSPANANEELTEVHVQMRPRCVAPQRAAAILAETGPQLLESLRNFLQLHTERRAELRFAYPKQLHVYPVLPQGDLGAPFLAQGKDISSIGMGLYFPCQPPTPSIYLQVTPADRAPVAVPARVMRAQPAPDGRLEVGVVFAWEELS